MHTVGRFAGVALGMMLALGATDARAEEAAKVIKFATLAPEGSSWMKLLHEWASNIEKRAPAVKIKFFAGGVAGDERDAVRKMKLGQIQGGAVTAIGLGLIQPEVRVFELPFMFKNDAELDHVRGTLDADIRKKFEDKGYVLLNWGDVGPVHLFTNLALSTRDDLNKVKIWEWSDDPLVKALFKEIGIKGVPLGVPDVLPSLQTGLIDACYGSPLSTLALQWNTKVKFMTAMTLSQSIGAQVITRKAWEDLGAANQGIVREETQKLQERLLKTIRQDNVRALEKMKALGLKEAPTPQPLVEEFEKQGREVAKKLEGQVYSAEFRARVEKLVADYRASHK